MDLAKNRHSLVETHNYDTKNLNEYPVCECNKADRKDNSGMQFALINTGVVSHSAW